MQYAKGTGMGKASHRKQDRGGTRRLSQGQRRKLRTHLMEAAQQDAALFEELLTQYRAGYERTAADLARPATDFVGFRHGRQVVSISSRPSSPEALLERFTLACVTLDALAVDQVVVLAGDEWAAPLLAPEDHTADLDLFIVLLAARLPVAGSLVGLLIPYSLDRETGTVAWATARGLAVSSAKGLWAEVLAPMCFARTAPTGRAAIRELLAHNEQVDNDVLLL
jgi:hypothetical protein